MANLQQLKKSLLAEAVSENLDLIAGRLPSRRGPTRRPSRRLHAVVGVLAAGLAITLALLVRDRLADPRASADPATGAPRSATSTPGSASSQGPPPRESQITASALGLVDPGIAADGAPGDASAADERLYSAPTRIDPAILPLTVRRVILDPGHGGEQHNGTEAEGLLEKELTLDIAQRLEQLLTAGGYDVAMTRTADVAVELADRVSFANERRGDLFVSIHVNWLGTTDARGIETFYLGPTDDPVLEQLANVENRASGYSLTDFRRLLDGIYADARRDASRELATGIHGELVRHLRKVSPNLRDRGVKTAPFVVLIGTEMPAVLAEVSCLSSAEEIELLRSPSYRQQIAEALHAGIATYARSLETRQDSVRPATTVAAGLQER